MDARYWKGSVAGAVFVGLLLVAGTAWGQAAERRAAIPPAVMVILDTSRSMNWMTNDYEALNCGSGSNQCSNPAQTNFPHRTRLMMAKEVLTGSYYNAARCCRIVDGDGSGLNYRWLVNSSGALAPQREDGVLHRYRENVKFGFAGMRTKYPASGTDYGPYRYVGFDNSRKYHGIFNTSAAAPAPLVYPIISDDRDEIIAGNNLVINTVRNYQATSGTPLGPAIADLHHVLVYNDETYKRTIGGTLREDYKRDCRPKAVILVTDGAPSAGWGEGTSGGFYACEPPLPDANLAGQCQRIWLDAARMHEDGVSLYVVSFAYEAMPTDIDLAMKKTAYFGGTCRAMDGVSVTDATLDSQLIALGGNGGGCYYNAATPGGLRLAMSAVISDILAGKTTRTHPVSTSRISRLGGASYGEKVGVYEVFSGFEVVPGGASWRGILERVTYTCEAPDDTEPPRLVPTGYLDMGDQLARRLACKIRLLPSGTLVDEIPDDYEGDYEYVQDGFNGCGANRTVLASDGTKLVSVAVDGDVLSPPELVGDDLCDDDALELVEVTINGTTFNIFRIKDENYALHKYDCQTDGDCHGNKVCDRGKCTKAHNQCSAADPSCTCLNPNGTINTGHMKEWDFNGTTVTACMKVCHLGTCHEIPPGNHCFKHSDCSDGRVCHAGSCKKGVRTGPAVQCSSPVEPVKMQVLGPIHHSNPVIQVGPELDLPFPGYKSFSREHWKRHTMLYMGGNDGMLHAFLLGKQNDDVKLDPDFGSTYEAKDGDEVWAFVPRAVIKNLGNLTQGSGSKSYVDATPTIKDIRLYRKVAEGTVSEEWGTVLAGGLRGGGRSYFALNITEPLKPKLLWEIEAKVSSGFDALAYTYATPALGTVLVGDGDDVEEVGVAIFPGGVVRGYEDVESDPDAGKAIYVVRLHDGKLLKAITTHAGGDFPDALTSSPGVDSSVASSQITHAFIGDAGGRLYRLHFATPNPSDWRVELFFDPRSEPQMGGAGTIDGVYVAPAVVRMLDGSLSVVYGNGNTDNLGGVDHDGYFVTSLNWAVGQGLPLTTSNWFVRFNDPLYGVHPKGEKLTGAPVVYNNTVFFPTFVPGDDDCRWGNGRIWASDVSELKGGVEISSLNIGAHSNFFFDLADGTVVYGLEIAPRPACAISPSGVGGGLPRQSQAKPQLLIQTGAPPFDSAVGSGHTEMASHANLQQEVLRVDLPPPRSSMRVLSWGVVFN